MSSPSCSIQIPVEPEEDEERLVVDPSIPIPPQIYEDGNIFDLFSNHFITE